MIIVASACNFNKSKMLRWMILKIVLHGSRLEFNGAFCILIYGRHKKGVHAIANKSPDKSPFPYVRNRLPVQHVRSRCTASHGGAALSFRGPDTRFFTLLPDAKKAWSPNEKEKKGTSLSSRIAKVAPTEPRRGRAYEKKKDSTTHSYQLRC